VAVLKDAGHDASMTPGGKGQFDVIADGSLVYSKQDAGRFPEEAEVLELLPA
jgi:selT/selW/selH-like putative selenoprotein